MKGEKNKSKVKGKSEYPTLNKEYPMMKLKTAVRVSEIPLATFASADWGFFFVKSGLTRVFAVVF